ncbi:MAG: helix-turn-helix protein [Clostridiaceae bacterium]|nr:helix-turn-helix protein [Clostridiaceae bacterium]
MEIKYKYILTKWKERGECMNLKVNLKVERAKRNWTQSDLAEESGVCRLTISNLENGKQNIENLQVKQLFKLAKALEISINEFFSEEK